MTAGAEKLGQRGNCKWNCPVERNLALRNSHCSSGQKRVATQANEEWRVEYQNGNVLRGGRRGERTLVTILIF